MHFLAFGVRAAGSIQSAYVGHGCTNALCDPSPLGRQSRLTGLRARSGLAVGTSCAQAPVLPAAASACGRAAGGFGRHEKTNDESGPR